MLGKVEDRGSLLFFQWLLRRIYAEMPIPADEELKELHKAFVRMQAAFRAKKMPTKEDMELAAKWTDGDAESMGRALAKAVKFFRERRGISRLQLAKKAQLPLRAILAIERGRVFDISPVMNNLTRGLGIEAGELTDDNRNPIKGGPVMADQTLAVIRKIMNWWAARSDDFRSPIVRGMARTKPKDRARERILTDDELRSVWKTAQGGEGPFERFLQFLLLTAARRTEAAGMASAELSNDNWTLPSARNKTKVDLVRPLCDEAMRVLSRAPRIAGCDFVFSTDGKSPISGFSKFKKEFDEECGVKGWTLHDLRRTARSLMSRAGVRSDIAELCLGHVITGVRGTYDRYAYHAEKKQSYEALAAQIDRIVNPKENIVSISERRS